MKVYHYAPLDSWFLIKNGSKSEGLKPGLHAKGRVGQMDPEAWKTTAIFCLDDPMPQKWVDNKQFGDVWGRLKSGVGKLLLEIEIDPEIDPVFVIEGAHNEGGKLLSHPEFRETAPASYLHEDITETESAYIKTKIPLRDYIEGGVQYILPEIVITGDVSIDKISVSEMQPILEEKLREGEVVSARYEERIKRITELSTWYQHYKQSLEQKESREIKIR